MAEKAAFDPKVFKESADEKSNARLKMWLEICAHCGLCADTCHFYLSNERDPKMIPAYKVKKVLEAVKKKDKIIPDFKKENEEAGAWDNSSHKESSSGSIFSGV